VTALSLTGEQRLDYLRLIRSDNVGPRGIMAQTPPLAGAVAGLSRNRRDLPGTGVAYASHLAWVSRACPFAGQY